MSLGENVKRLRKSKKILKPMLPIDLAKAANMSTAQICNLEKGRGENPTISTLSRLADALGVTVDELIKESKD